MLARIPIPARLVYGGASNFYSTGTAEYVRDSIPNALLRIYEGVDHAPHLWERERFVKDVLDFIDAGTTTLVPRLSSDFTMPGWKWSGCPWVTNTTSAGRGSAMG